MLPHGGMAFDHETRRMIYNHILTYPGVPYITLKNIYDLTDGTLRYHLEYLEKAERILSNIENGKRVYYPIQNDVSDARLFAGKTRSYKFTSIQQKILNTIKRIPGITQKELINKNKLQLISSL